MHNQTPELVAHLDKCIEAISNARGGITGDASSIAAHVDTAPWQLAASLEALRTARQHLDVAHSLLLEHALSKGLTLGTLGFQPGSEPPNRDP